MLYKFLLEIFLLKVLILYHFILRYVKFFQSQRVIDQRENWRLKYLPWRPCLIPILHMVPWATPEVILEHRTRNKHWIFMSVDFKEPQNKYKMKMGRKLEQLEALWRVHVVYTHNRLSNCCSLYKIILC